jgi:hypothetical protein
LVCVPLRAFGVPLAVETDAGVLGDSDDETVEALEAALQGLATNEAAPDAAPTEAVATGVAAPCGAGSERGQASQ